MSDEILLPERDDAPDTLLQELLSPTLNAKLASLALRSQEAADLADELERQRRFLDPYAADQSDVGATVRLLGTKVEQLRELSCQLSRRVMQHAHRLEDAAELAAALLPLADQFQHREDDS